MRTVDTTAGTFIISLRHLVEFYGILAIALIPKYRAYTKEWCGFNSDSY
jgi:hypothetical protein